MRLFAVIASAVAMSACGGGGAPVHPSGTFRANVPGDSWDYSVSIDYGSFGTYGGTLTESLTNDTYNNQPSIRSTRTFNLQLQQGPATITSYAEIGTNGTLLAELLSGNLVAVTSDSFHIPSSIGPSTSVSGSIALADGETVSETYKVANIARVSTAGGTFDCWVVNQRVTWSNGTSDVFTLWVAPETGNYVKISDQTTNPDGSTYSYVAALTSIVSVPSSAESVQRWQDRLGPVPEQRRDAAATGWELVGPLEPTSLRLP